MNAFFFIYPILIIAAAALGYALGRYSLSGKWHTRYVHNCGYHNDTVFSGNPCPGCGQIDSLWNKTTMRATWPWGWEIKS